MSTYEYCGCFHYRGVPGIDWDINNPSQSDISKVFYSVIDPNLVLSSSKCSYQYISNVCMCIRTLYTYVYIIVMCSIIKLLSRELV